MKPTAPCRNKLKVFAKAPAVPCLFLVSFQSSHMSKSHPKAKHYTALLKKMEAAIKAKYYLEACWVAYAILEDRVVTALLCTAVRHNKMESPSP
jgi:hypothetical protein